MKDIENTAEYSSKNTGISYNHIGNFKSLSQAGQDAVYNSLGLLPKLLPESKKPVHSPPQSAIADGRITVHDEFVDIRSNSRDTANSLNKLDKIFDKKKVEERQELARLFAKDAFEQLHYWEPKTKEEKAAKAIAHGVVAEVSARVAGNKAGSGFYAGVTNEALIGEIQKVAKTNPAVAQWLSAGVGAVVNAGLGKPVITGAAEAQYGTRDNHLHEFDEDESLDRAIEGMHQKIKSELIASEPILSIPDPTSEKNMIAFAAEKSGLPAASFLLKQAVWGNGEFQYYNNDSPVATVFKNSYHFQAQIAEMRVRIPPGKSMVVSGYIDYNNEYNGIRATKDQHLAYGIVKTALLLTHNVDGSMSYRGVIGDAYNFEIHKLSISDSLYKTVTNVINNFAVVDQIYGIIRPFGWQANISGRI
ncbi:hypothetical protein HMPREF1521_1789 [Veillonella sp. AS16]|nr:hypothetical protein HMPREF1521_1789 [Veillonella sp. AS16]